VLYDSPMRDDDGAASVHGDGHESAGGLAAAVVAAFPFIILNGPNALVLARWLLAALPALTGYAIARERGNTPVRAFTVTLIVGAAGLAVVAIKSALAH